MKSFPFFLFNFLSRALAKLSRIFLKLELRWGSADPQYLNILLNGSSSKRGNMVKAPDEPFYADQYWQAILFHLDKLPRDAKILDLGCGPGRFTVKLGKCFTQGQIVGCDLSGKAIAQAKNYATQESVRNIDLRIQSITDCLESFSEKSVDAIMITEVTFFYPNWKQDLPRIIHVLKPDGILIISFRPQYFYALKLVRDRLWDGIESILQERQGRVLGSSVTFTWQTSKEIKMLLTQEYGMILLELRGIGACSGIPDDPHDHICQPSQLTTEEKKKLMKLELKLGETFPDSGRYILAVARKPKF